MNCHVGLQTDDATRESFWLDDDGSFNIKAKHGMESVFYDNGYTWKKAIELGKVEVSTEIFAIGRARRHFSRRGSLEESKH